MFVNVDDKRCIGACTGMLKPKCKPVTLTATNVVKTITNIRSRTVCHAPDDVAFPNTNVLDPFLLI